MNLAHSIPSLRWREYERAGERRRLERNGWRDCTFASAARANTRHHRTFQRKHPDTNYQHNSGIDYTANAPRPRHSGDGKESGLPRAAAEPEHPELEGNKSDRTCVIGAFHGCLGVGYDAGVALT